MASRLLSELTFGSFLVYSPRGTSERSVESRKVRDQIKAGKGLIQQAVGRLVASFEQSGLVAVLGPDVTLVPTPRSSRLVPGGLWPPRLICEALVAVGLGRDLAPCLERTTAIPKASFQGAGQRPNARMNYVTMAVTQLSLGSRRITLVDDFVTKGNTLIGAASQLAEAFPNAEIKAFALVRTMGLIPDVDRLIAPFVGKITSSGDEANREGNTL